MKTDFLLFLLLLSLGCNSQSQPVATSQQQIEVVDTIPKLSCEDPNWALDDTLFRTQETEFFFELLPGASMGFPQKIKLKDGFLGIVAQNWASEQAIALYQTDLVNKWNLIYCGPLEGASTYKTSTPDLNFDGHKDLLIDGTDGGVHGNHFFVLFLFDPENKTFRLCDTPRLENLTIDSKNKQLRARHYGSIYGSNCKSLYDWKGDSLVLLEEADYQAYHPEVDAIIRLKKRQKDGSIKQDSIMGKMDPLWEFFKGKCVWKGDF